MGQEYCFWFCHCRIVFIFDHSDKCGSIFISSPYFFCYTKNTTTTTDQTTIDGLIDIIFTICFPFIDAIGISMYDERERNTNCQYNINIVSLANNQHMCVCVEFLKCFTMPLKWYFHPISLYGPLFGLYI